VQHTTAIQVAVAPYKALIESSTFPPPTSGFETKSQFILAMEYLPNGELFDYVWKKQGLEEPEARRLFAQIVEGVHYCHQVGSIAIQLQITKNGI
jgi:serine/threonine protein kinase